MISLPSPVRNIPPCKGCSRRVPACHDSCEDFLSWRKEVDRVRAVKKKYYDNFPKI